VSAPTVAGAGRGRIGLAGEPVGRLKRAKKGKMGRGNLAHHVKKRRASSRVKGRRQRRGSTTAAARAALRQAGTQAPSVARSWWRLSLDNKRHVRQPIVLGEGKDRAAMHFTDGVRRRDEAEAAAPGKLVLEHMRGCAAGAKRGAGARV
jgi:hypothetical protein